MHGLMVEKTLRIYILAHSV